MQKVANRDVRDSGWEIAHAAVSRRLPIPLYTMVPRTGGYTYDVAVWDLSIILLPVSVAPCQTLTIDGLWSATRTKHGNCISISPYGPLTSNTL
jgi:hypothetical protein